MPKAKSKRKQLFGSYPTRKKLEKQAQEQLKQEKKLENVWEYYKEATQR